jgi:hypothetical protein
MWKLSYVTPIFKKGRNCVEDKHGVAILSANPKRFELLVYRTMFDDLKNLVSVNQHGFMKNRSTVTVMFEVVLVLNSIEEEGRWIPFTRTHGDEFFGACGRHGFCDAGIYQKTVIRVLKSIHSEVSLHVFSSFEAGVRQLCMEPILSRACRQG